MDEQDVHHFWGISPAVDLLAVAEATRASDLTGSCASQPINILQAASYDARHTITTLCQLHRHPQLQQRPVHLYVYEEEPEVLLRHLLLLSILLDSSLLARERMETLLEVHGNALVREKTATYLEQQSRALEALLTRLSTSSATPAPHGTSLASLLQGVKLDKKQAQKPYSNSTWRIGTTAASMAASSGAAGCEQPGAVAATHPNGSDATAHGKVQTSYDALALMGELIDLGLLRYQDKDRLIEALGQYRAAAAPYDMVKAWDARQRKWYGDRYDARTNMVDWDYHMVLAHAGTPGQDAEKGSVIHFQHFRHWRLQGVAYELRDAWYNTANRSLLSTAYGRTREFKDRNCKDVGRSVSAWGYWGDCLNSPYHCWGTKCEDEAFYKFSNKQWSRTAVDIAEHNVLALLHELRHAERQPAAGNEAHRARTARGPTSLADLQEESARTARAQEAATVQAPVAGQTEPSKQQENNAANGVSEPSAVAAAAAAAGQAQVQECPQEQAAAVTMQEAAGSSDATFIPSAMFQGPKPGYVFKHGKQGMGYYWDTRKQGAAAGVLQAVTAEAPTNTVQADAQHEQRCESVSDVQAAPADKDAEQSTHLSVTTRSGMEAVSHVSELQRQAAAVNAAEAALDASAAARLRAAGVRIIPVLGGLSAATASKTAQTDDKPVSMLAKLLTNRPKFAGTFQVLSVGHRHVHLLGADHHLATAAAPGALLLVEGARGLLQLPKAEQSEAFATKVKEMAAAGGWGPAPQAAEAQVRTSPLGCSAGMVLTDAHLLFALPQPGAVQHS